MASVYGNLIDMARTLIAEKGMSAVLRKLTAGAPAVPGHDWDPGPNVATDATVKIVPLPEETINLYFNVRIPHTNDQEGFEYCLMANNGIIPSLDDVVIIAGVQKKVRYVMTYKPDGNVILHIIGMRF